jgi:hypothetical protein
MTAVPAWADPTLPLSARAEALLAAAETRGDIKALGRWLDGEGAALRAVLLARLAEGDVEEALPGKKLLRRALAREADAQVLRSPIARDEGFTCLHCGANVPPHGRTARDHCPRCLRSVHVDVVPGDRAADCGGVLHPFAVELRGEDVVLRFRCARCGATRHNRALRDGDPPDDWAAIVRLSAGHAP